MELELKHLAPYLPYGLKIQGQTHGEIQEMSEVNENNVNIKDRGFTYGWWADIFDIKPILRPLSDLNKEENIDVWNYILNDDAYDLSTLCEHNGDISHQLMYQVFDALVKTHFDVFGLIEKGFAIDKNTIEP